MRDFDCYLPTVTGLDIVGVVWIGAGVADGRQRFTGFGPCIAHIERGISRCVDEYSDSLSSYIERHRRMRVSGIEFRVCVDPHYLLLSPLSKRQKLQAQTVNLLMGTKRQFDDGTPLRDDA